MARKTASDDPRRTEYGARLKRARLALGLTQAAVAARLGVSDRYVSDLEAGRRLESWPAWLAMVRELSYDPAVVAPELVDACRLVAQTRCPSTDVETQTKKTDRQSRQ